MICERDPAAAEARDARILAEGGGQPRTVTRQEIVPPLQKGLLAFPLHPAHGTLFPQPWIRTANGRQLLDSVVGTGWRLVLDDRNEPDLTADATRLDMRLIRLGVRPGSKQTAFSPAGSTTTLPGRDRPARPLRLRRRQRRARARRDALRPRDTTSINHRYKTRTSQ